MPSTPNEAGLHVTVVIASTFSDHVSGPARHDSKAETPAPQSAKVCARREARRREPKRVAGRGEGIDHFRSPASGHGGERRANDALLARGGADSAGSFAGEEGGVWR